MAIDTYIKFGEGTDLGPDGKPLPLIMGDSDDEKHFWWCELRGCDFELEASRLGKEGESEESGDEKRRTELKPISVKKRVDWASTGLFMKCCEAAEATTKKADDKQDKGRIKEVTIHVCRATGEKSPYLIVKYTGVTITKYGIDISSPEPSESITFTAEKSEFSYQQSDPHSGEKKGPMVPSGDLDNYTPPPSGAGGGQGEANAPAAAAAAAAAAGGAGAALSLIPGASGNGAAGGVGSATDAAAAANFPGLWNDTGFGILPD